jgi:hypothetical protein
VAKKQKKESKEGGKKKWMEKDLGLRLEKKWMKSV